MRRSMSVEETKDVCRDRKVWRSVNSDKKQIDKLKIKEMGKPRKPRLRKVSWRIRELAKPKNFTPKVTGPFELRFKVHPSTLTGRMPERVLAAALPYERILVATRDQFRGILPSRFLSYISTVLEKSSNTIYSKLVKRPQCVGTPIEEMKFKVKRAKSLTKRNKMRIFELAQPRKRVDKKDALERKFKNLSELMPRILKMAEPPPWRIYKRLSQDPKYKDPTKLKNVKALSYVPTPRILKLAKPRRTPDSLESNIQEALWAKFDKKLDFVVRKKFLAKKAKDMEKKAAKKIIALEF